MNDEVQPDPSGAELRGERERRERRPEHPALTDDDTGLPNALYFDTVFEVVFEMSDRGIPLGLLIFEVDGLEGFEPSEGAPSAGEAVRAGGIILDALTRRMDLFAALGDGRFGMLLLDCNEGGALIAADRMVDELAGWRAETGLGMSVGAAAWRAGMATPQALRDAAEGALADARAAGGGRVGLARS